MRAVPWRDGWLCCVYKFSFVFVCSMGEPITPTKENEGLTDFGNVRWILGAAPFTMLLGAATFFAILPSEILNIRHSGAFRTGIPVAGTRAHGPPCECARCPCRAPYPTHLHCRRLLFSPVHRPSTRLRKQVLSHCVELCPYTSNRLTSVLLDRATRLELADCSRTLRVPGRS